LERRRNGMEGVSAAKGQRESSRHRIRLRGPWQVEPVAWLELTDDRTLLEGRERPLPPGGTVKVPGDWGGLLGSEFRGRVVFTRRFGRPLNFDSAAPVELTLDGVDARAELWLNGERLGEVPWGEFSGRFSLSSPLLPRNELRIQVDCPAMGPELARRFRPLDRADQSGGLFADVTLDFL
jgi:hypothetical protein